MAKLKLSIKNKKLILGILITLLILAVYRLGFFIHLPFINTETLSQFAGSGSMFGFLDIFSGGALSNFSIVALGVSPYITASIVVQLLQMDIVPILKEWTDEGDAGKEKINALTKYLAIGLAFIQSLTIIIGLSSTQKNMFFEVATPITAMTFIYLAIVMTAGTAFVLWLAERITQNGIGNGTSIIIVVGIIASYPDMIDDLMQKYILGDTTTVGGVFIFIGVILIMILIIVGVVFMEAAQRKIPIQYSNRPSSAALRGKNESNIPIKLNAASVIPVIFASTLMSLPTTVASFVNNSTAADVINMIFSTTEPIGFVLYIVLIVVFSFFYAFLQMNPEKMAENLKNQNAYVPGIRPGEETASYFSRVLFKITVVGATYLTILASIPIIMTKIWDLPSSVHIGGTGLIIVVGVAIETTKQIKTAAQEKQYRGFID